MPLTLPYLLSALTVTVVQAVLDRRKASSERRVAFLAIFERLGHPSGPVKVCPHLTGLKGEPSLAVVDATLGATDGYPAV